MHKNDTITETHVRLAGEAVMRYGCDIKPIDDNDILKNFTIHPATNEIMFWFNTPDHSTRIISERHLAGGLQ